jgi:hypothetical protein
VNDTLDELGAYGGGGVQRAKEVWSFEIYIFLIELCWPNN